MASPARLCLHILKVIARNLWAVLFFLVVLSTLALVHHFWDLLVSVGFFIQNLILKGLDFLQTR